MEAQLAALQMWEGLDSKVMARLLDDSDKNAAEATVSTTTKKQERRQRKATPSQGKDHSAPPSLCTVLFVPTAPDVNLNFIDQLQLSEKLKELAPDQIAAFRVNRRKKIMAADFKTRAAALQMLGTKNLAGVDVESFLARPQNTRAGVVTRVGRSIAEDQLESMISSKIQVVQVQRLGTSGAVKVIFEGDTLPAAIKIGLVRHKVKPYVPRPLQCRRCYRLGHVAKACTDEKRCPRCSQSHDGKECSSGNQECINCRKPHEATSAMCPKLKREKAVCVMKERSNMTYSDVIGPLRKRLAKEKFTATVEKLTSLFATLDCGSVPR